MTDDDVTVLPLKRGDTKKIRFNVTNPTTSDPIDLSDPETWTVSCQMAYLDEDSVERVTFTFTPEDLAAGTPTADITPEISEALLEGAWKIDLRLDKLSPRWRRTTKTFEIHVVRNVTR